MIPLTDEENKSYKNQKVLYVCKKGFSTDDEVRDHCHYTGKYRGAALSICNLRYKIKYQKKFMQHFIMVLHMIIIQQKKKNIEKDITFSVPIKIELDNDKTITYKLEFIDSFRFMSTALSKLRDNLSEIFCKKCRDKNCKSECDYKGLKNNKLSYNRKKFRENN